MPTYVEAVDTVTAAAEERVLALWAAFTAGQISRAEFDATAADILDLAAARAGAVADAALAARITELSGSEVTPLGLAGPTPNIRAELAAIAGTALAVETALGVATRAVVRQAGQDVWTQGIRDHGVPGWRRIHVGSKCGPCTNLAVAEFIASSITMWRHRGCDCHPDPVLEDPRAQ